MRREIGILITAFFITLVVLTTFPLVFRINDSIPGFFASDESYAPIWNAWRVKFSVLHGLPLKETDLIAYPFGIEIYKGVPFFNLFIGINNILAVLTTPAITYNLQVIINFFLSALLAFTLVYFLTKYAPAAFLSGVIFGFCPYIFARSWQHLTETYIWLIPLVLLVLFKLKDRFQVRSCVYFVIGLILAAGINFGIAYHIMIATLAFFIYLVLYDLKNRKQLSAVAIRNDICYVRNIALLGALVISILATQFYYIAKNIILAHGSTTSGFNLYHRPFNDLFTQSAKPLSYFLPAAVHPLFGKFTERFIGSPLYGVSYTEHTLYLGWAALILAFLAFRNWCKKRKLYANEDFYIGFFVWLVVVAWLFSQPPYFTFPYFKIYMPSFFMYKILPMFRAYCRFGIVVMLAVAVLAGFGLKFVLARFKSQKMKILITALCCSLVLFEFWNWPPLRVMNLTKYPKVYDWLRLQKGDFAIAEYPLDIESPNEYYKFCQTIHEKRIINGTIPGTHANEVARKIWKLSDPKTAPILSWMGVKYVLVHHAACEASDNIQVYKEYEKIKSGNIEGLEFVRTIEGVDIYAVKAKPQIP